jgi:hypothetical protein
MTPELTVYMLPCRYEAFSEVLYGDEYGFGEHTLTLEVVSGQYYLDVTLRVLCRYNSNLPTSSTRIDKDF